MKIESVLVLAVLVISLCSFTLSTKLFSSVGNIDVIVRGIIESEGQIGILLFKNEDGFPTDHKQAMKQVLIPVKGTEFRYLFRDIPFGKYAIAVMHDVNMNNKLDTNFFGIPEEGSGVSNNARGTFSAPKFKDASFSLEKEKLTITIDLNY